MFIEDGMKQWLQFFNYNKEEHTTVGEDINYFICRENKTMDLRMSHQVFWLKSGKQLFCKWAGF